MNRRNWANLVTRNEQCAVTITLADRYVIAEANAYIDELEQKYLDSLEQTRGLCQQLLDNNAKVSLALDDATRMLRLLHNPIADSAAVIGILVSLVEKLR